MNATTRFPFSFPLDRAEILRKRALILSALLRMDSGFCSIPARSLSEETLNALLALYDEHFFSRFLKQTYASLEVTLSSRLTSSAGKFICVRHPLQFAKRAEIRMSSDFLCRLKDGPFTLNGLIAATPQEAFLIVFEHELCHAAETALFGATGHSKRFLHLANGLFGHTQTRHSLPTRRQEAAAEGLLIGSRISFPYKGMRLSGIVTYIGKTATVMVPDPVGAYRDRRGRRYAKYRVPVSILKKE